MNIHQWDRPGQGRGEPPHVIDYTLRADPEITRILASGRADEGRTAVLLALTVLFVLGLARLVGLG